MPMRKNLANRLMPKLEGTHLRRERGAEPVNDNETLFGIN